MAPTGRRSKRDAPPGPARGPSLTRGLAAAAAALLCLLAGCNVPSPLGKQEREQTPPLIVLGGTGAISHAVLLDPAVACAPAGPYECPWELGVGEPGALWVHVRLPDPPIPRSLPLPPQPEVHVSGGSSTPVQGSLDTPPLLLYDEGAEDIKIRVLGPGCLSREGTLPRLADVLYEQDLSGVLAVHFVSAAVPIEVGLADRERVPSGTVVRTLPALVGKEQLGTSFTTPCELPLGDPVYVPARRPLRLELRFSAGEERTWNQVAEIQTPGVTDMLPGFYEVSSGDVPRNWRFRVTLRGRDVSGNAKCRVPRVTAVFPCDDGVLLTRAPRAVEVTADLPGGIQITGKARPVADPELESAIAAAVSDAVTARLSLAPTGCWLTIRPRTSSGREAVIHRVVSIGPKGTVRRFVDEAFLPPGRYRLQIWYRIPGRAGLVSHELRRTLVDSDTCELSAALPTP